MTRPTVFAMLLAGILFAFAGAADPASPPGPTTEIVILASAAQNGELVPCG